MSEPTRSSGVDPSSTSGVGPGGGVGPPSGSLASSAAPLFGRESLQRHVDAVLGTIPAGKRGVILAVNAGNGWIEVLTMARIADQWDIAGRLRHERANGTTASVEIRGMW
jgi:hypothetical protein